MQLAQWAHLNRSLSVCLVIKIRDSTMSTVEPHLGEHPWDQALLSTQLGFVRFNRKKVWDLPESFIEEGCSPEQSVR